MTLPALKSGLEKLVDGVKAYFTGYGVTASVDVGVTRLARQDTQGPGGANRVVFVPFDPTSGDGGSISQPDYVGEHELYDDSDPPKRYATARAIGEWRRTMVVSVWAIDATKKNDALAQAIAHERLFELTKRAIDYVLGASVEWGAVRFVVPEERSFGLESRTMFRFGHPLFDAPLEVMQPTTFEIHKE